MVQAGSGGSTTGRDPSRRRLVNNVRTPNTFKPCVHTAPQINRLPFCIRFQGWSWHDCHQHWHYDNYAHYALRGLCSSGDVAWEDRPVVGHKNGWCAILSIIPYTTRRAEMARHVPVRSLPICPPILCCATRCVSDTDTYGGKGGHGRCNQPSDMPYLPLGLHDFTCLNMGISSGCSDEYHSNYDCQWIDITNVTDGHYWLTVSTGK